MIKVRRIVLGSLLAVIFGSLVCAVLWMIGIAVVERNTGAVLVYGLYVFAIGGVCALVAWAAIFVWVYAFVPRTSRLRQWPICTACGGLAGFLIVVFPFIVVQQGELALPVIAAFGGSGLVTGAATCWLAAVTAEHFRNE